VAVNKGKASSPKSPVMSGRPVLAALLRSGWTIKRQSGTSHRILARPGWPDLLFAYHDRVTLGPTAMKVLAKKTGLTTDDL
jgi:predicted RNA binding protein YcfA (HicA-like mRNA interferase family)